MQDGKGIFGQGVRGGCNHNDVERMAGAPGVFLGCSGHVVRNAVVGTRREPGFVPKGLKLSPCLFDVSPGPKTIVNIPER